MFVSLLMETLAVTGPIFILVLLGLLLARIGFIDDHFNLIASRLVFAICLPVLLFTTITHIDLAQTVDGSAIGFSLAAAVVTFLLSWVAALPLAPRIDRGVVVQGAFRSNLGVIGIALCANAYGAEGLALASLLMAGLTVTYNVLSVFILGFYSGNDLVWRSILLDIVRNPLIVAIGLAVAVSMLAIPLPGVLLDVGDYLGRMALPLALLGTGAGMSLRTLRQSSGTTVLVVLLKAFVLPVLVVGMAWLAGFRDMVLGVLFLLFVSPTATASYAMVKATGGNDRLAANLVMTTTLVCILTCSGGLFLLSWFGVV